MTLAIKAYEAAISSSASSSLNSEHWNIIDAEWGKIKAKHPLLFQVQDFGTLVGPGWWPILEEAMSGITRALELHPGSACQVQQIKEKFGGLRFYVQLTHQQQTSSEDIFYASIRTCIDVAESKSTRTCEACGEPGKLRGKSWRKTYCEKHGKE